MTDYRGFGKDLVGERVIVVHVRVDQIAEVAAAQLALDQVTLAPDRAGAEPRVDDDQTFLSHDNRHVGALEVVATPGEQHTIAQPLAVDLDLILRLGGRDNQQRESAGEKSVPCYLEADLASRCSHLWCLCERSWMAPED